MAFGKLLGTTAHKKTSNKVNNKKSVDFSTDFLF